MATVFLFFFKILFSGVFVAVPGNLVLQRFFEAGILGSLRSRSDALCLQTRPALIVQFSRSAVPDSVAPRTAALSIPGFVRLRKSAVRTPGNGQRRFACKFPSVFCDV